MSEVHLNKDGWIVIPSGERLTVEVVPLTEEAALLGEIRMDVRGKAAIHVARRDGVHIVTLLVNRSA